jgi:hypothetical protein
LSVHRAHIARGAGAVWRGRVGRVGVHCCVHAAVHCM